MNDLDIVLHKLSPDFRTRQTAIPLSKTIDLYLIDPAFVNKNYRYDESQPIINNPPFWAICWPSGYILADYIMQNPAIIKGRKIIDFGSGSGIVAVAAALAGADDVIACDLDENALKAVKANAELNNVKIKMCLSPEKEAQNDVLLAADVLYNISNLHMLDIFLECAPSVLLADSRVGNIDHPSYKKIFEAYANAFPIADMPELVSVYEGRR